MNCDSKEAVKYSKYSNGKFCSRECARSFSTKSKRKEINEKISKTMTGVNYRSGMGKPVEMVKRFCKGCDQHFDVAQTKRSQKYCSRKCAAKFRDWQALGRKGGRISAEVQKDTRRSKNEILFSELCGGVYKEVLCNEPMFNGWDADVIIPSIKVAVMWNGVWHYKKITEAHSVKQVQNRDRIKIKEIIKAGFTPYVIKDRGKHNPEFVNQEFDKFIKEYGTVS